AVAEFGGDIEIDGNLREALEPVFRDLPGIERGAASRDRDAVQILEVERQLYRQPYALVRHVEKRCERVADDFRLFENFLRHEVAMIAFVDEERAGRTRLHRARNFLAGGIANFDAVMMDDREIALFKIRNILRERRERDRVGTEIHLTRAVADRERASLARADQKVVLAFEQECEREGAAQLRKRRAYGFDRTLSAFHLVRHEMRDHFGVGLAPEDRAPFLQRIAQLAEILDNAVMHDGELVGRVRMR